MTSRILLVTLGLLVGTTSTLAEGAWVLWEESGDVQAFGHTAVPHPQSSYTNLEDCVKAIDAEWPKAWGTTEGPERHGFSRLTPTSAVVMVRYVNTNTTYIVTYTCLPETTQSSDRGDGQVRSPVLPPAGLCFGLPAPRVGPRLGGCRSVTRITEGLLARPRW